LEITGVQGDGGRAWKVNEAPKENAVKKYSFFNSIGVDAALMRPN
jgi:hypothetical protein